MNLPRVRPFALFATLTASLLLLSIPAWSQGVPPLLNYQGRVVVGSTNFNGTGRFKFALVNSGGTTTYWSNDGTSNAGGEPSAAVSLQVTGGLYSLALGDTSLPNMTALPASVFAANADVRLRVWFNDGTAGSQQLTPDQRITSVGYAQLAATVPDGAITSAKIGTGAVGASNLASGTAGTYQAVSGPTATAANTSYAATGASPVNFSLPSTAKVGDVVTISGAGAGGYSLTPSTGQSVSTPNGTVNPGAWTPRDSSRIWLAVASSADGARLVAGVDGGQLYTSTDSGVTWTPRESNRSWDALASSADGAKLVAGVDGGQLYTSTDSGVTWTPRDSNRSWDALASSADGARLVAGEYSGQLYTSTDSGVTWTPRDSVRHWYAVASSADGARLVAGEIGGQLYTSTDSGVTWTPRESNRNWEALASSADGARLVAGAYGGQLYTSTDSGVTWTPRDSVRHWYAVASSADGARLVAGTSGSQLYTSTDSGVTWTPRDSDRHWYAVASSADGARLVAGAYGEQLYTSISSLTGAQGSTAQLQYLGNGQWTTLNQSQVAAGAVGNAQLANSTLTINTSGTGLSGGGAVPLGGALTLSSNATSANTASTVVSRDASGNFGAGTITASLNGNATSATNASALGGMSATSSNTASTVVSRDASGSFSAGALSTGTVTATAPADGNLALIATGASTGGTVMRLGNLSTGGTAFQLVSTGSGGNLVGAGKLLFYTEANGGANLMTLDSSAHLGIGQAPVTNALEVNGNASKSTAGSWLANSDARIKTGIHPLTGALEALDRINPVGFHYTAEYRAAHPEIADVEYQNVIAQEFREVFPDAVKGSGERLADGSEILQVDTYPALIESLAAIKELHVQVREQETELKRLRQESAEYESRLRRLERAAEPAAK